MKIALLYIATGKYIVLWKDFFESFERNFCTDSEKEYFIFTDAIDFIYSKNKNVNVITQESLGWPDNTLKRFHMFSRIDIRLQEYDYIFFFNANCLCEKKITEKEFINDKELIFASHPGYFNKASKFFPYERNKKSTAYIPFGEGEKYVFGAVNGGKSSAYLSLISTLKEQIDFDLNNGFVAKWHDESHLNHFFYTIQDKTNIAILSPSYCFPEDSAIPYECKILVRDKSKYFDVDAIKLSKTKRIEKKIKRIIKKIIKRIMGKGGKLPWM